MAKSDGKLALRVGDEAVKAKTGKTWREWFGLLDKAGARKLNHQEIVSLLSEKHGLGPWWQQMVAVGYEQARGLREKHEGPAGYEISKSVTVGAPVAQVFRAFQNQAERKLWLSNPGLTLRKTTPYKYLRAIWSDGKTHLNVNFYPKGVARTQVSAQHGKIPTAVQADRLKDYWAKQLMRLRAHLES